MDSRVILVGIALLLCMLSSTEASFTFSAVITRDAMVDSGGNRQVAIDIETTLTSTNSNAQVTGSSFVYTTGSSIFTPAGPTQDAVFGAANCATPSTAGSVCTQRFTTILTRVDDQCHISGDFNYTYNLGDSVTTATVTNLVTLADHDVCGASLYTVTADITSFGAYADPLFSQTKSTYYVNDMVYFPFQIKYRDLTISSLVFDTIIVDSGTVSSVIYSSSNTGAGNALSLQTSPAITQVNSGATTTAWFGLQISREDGSPFAATPAALTPYTFSVVFDVEYKNAKRNELKVPVGTQLRSQSTIIVSGEQSKVRNSLEERSIAPSTKTNTGHSLQMGLISTAFVAFFFGVMF